MTTLISNCRLSGESLNNARLLFELADCPFPGIYPPSAEESVRLRSPLRIVQSTTSGFVQLAHEYDSSVYRQYAFAGGQSFSYRRHMTRFAEDIAETFPQDARILEVGCGDGWLVKELKRRGFNNVIGIDPSRAGADPDDPDVVRGFFPKDLPPSHALRQFDLIVSRHVLEHIEAPRPFIKALATSLATSGQLWIEVPDLDSTLRTRLWSNFYQLHCNYFTAATLDLLAVTVGLRCIGGSIVDVFGGSLLRKYVMGEADTLRPADHLSSLIPDIELFRNQLNSLAAVAPVGSVGYGAAERTAMTLGLSPLLASKVEMLYDGNPLLSGRYLGGTDLEIAGKADFLESPPPAVFLFAISNATEILQEWHALIPPDTLVGVVGGDFPFKPLRDYP